MTDLRRATRVAYRDRIAEVLARDPRTVCVDTDTGLFQGVDFGAAAHRYVNVGIAEHNAMGLAAGLAAGGFTPFVHTFATFAAMRAAEAVKIDIAYNALPVRIAATHSGLSAGHFGPTHHALEDLAVMRCLPNMTVVVPADAAGTEALLEQTLGLPGPLYLRLGRKPTPPLPAGAAPPRLGFAQVLRTGPDVLLVACGPHPVHAALGAAELLAADGIRAGVLNMHTVKPLDVPALLAHSAGRALVVTVEEHWRAGGLGGAVAEALAESGPVRVLRLGVDDTFASVVGDHDALARHYGIDPASVAGRIRSALSVGPPVIEEELHHGHRLSRM
ncbi:transketolase [Actinoplanes sp. NBRC 14428]|uniref:Transketolase n=1 Tax=Pseudosporangium ferrugineum TaxID=439699 RepID=A0A2T0RLM7_9ACTN|nr:transketolase C-terminal domain-containing protein [Pseudosporangium ferrugineum]PRY22037.1 transketolase [Pseudosporangium ferrugineum]BCJ50687.1 transketolase [Actinoplanes sp. NBRC 14428]